MKPISAGLFGASFSSLAAAVPALGGSGFGGSSGSSGGGGGGDGSGNWGAGGPHGAAPLFVLAAADDSKQKGKDGKSNNPALDMITDSSELDEMAEEAGGYDGERRGNQRCVEVVIDGWPEVGSLPSQVRIALARQRISFALKHL